MRIGVYEILPIKEKDFDFEVRLYFCNGDYLPAKISGGDLETALDTIFITREIGSVKKYGWDAESD
ncbi:MAG: hypothetical protein ABIG69_02995 [Bacteroidota bacterium]